MHKCKTCGISMEDKGGVYVGEEGHVYLYQCPNCKEVLLDHR